MKFMLVTYNSEAGLKDLGENGMRELVRADESSGRWSARVSVTARSLQLTSDAARPGAHRFYASLGFVPSHVGFKLRL